jgi:hypothetical protein
LGGEVRSYYKYVVPVRAGTKNVRLGWCCEGKPECLGGEQNVVEWEGKLGHTYTHKSKPNTNATVSLPIGRIGTCVVVI